MHPLRSASLLLATALLVGGCGGPAAPTPSAVSGAPSAGGSGSAVTIMNFAFQPAAMTIPVGTTLTWTNQDAVAHQVAADDGSFKGQPISSGATFSHSFGTPGAYPYHCAIHPSMKATITVK